ncbi:MAG TPA: DinB family protein [Candidatus Angelobacter sp.]|nr:DinB family protein [Candidatus Angelobacter sp.]
MKLDVQSVSRDIADSRRRAHALIDTVSADQLTRRPDPGKWSIAECLVHLNVTAATVQQFMAQGIKQGKEEKKLGSGPFSIGPKGRLMVWIAEPPPKFRIRAPKKVRPPATIDDPLRILPQFLQAQDEWERLMHEQEGLNLAKIKVGQGAFRVRLAAALPWMMAHQRRHLLQAENVKRQILSAASKTAASSTI